MNRVEDTGVWVTFAFILLSQHHKRKGNSSILLSGSPRVRTWCFPAERVGEGITKCSWRSNVSELSSGGNCGFFSFWLPKVSLT